ncbi:glycoside hydrolase [Sphingobium sp. BYY-5]|uniref:glycosyl hydrolase n=1 Tax=Sphingobium sp. BYY-5 TaxID=2926400 RepID=UPI001FA6B861|nr:glycosyl hydrolase [Sphingobium sp. BYY-5]MCI4591754.1 glycoside hydrolase [Sphingobium sp. BYY-5]
MITNTHRGLLKAAFLATSLLFAAPLLAADDKTVADPLLGGFETPPDSARPRVWWHWLSGNIDKVGIRADLEWMKSIGIAGAQMFDGDMGAPQIVPHRIKALTPEWLDHLQYAASEADRLGLEFAMAAAPGWSETGGPWVQPEAGMKKIVWSELRVAGGHGKIGKLPAPPSVAGPFLDMQKKDHQGKPVDVVKGYYRDVAVIAYRAPKGDVSLADLKPTLSSAQAGLDLAALVDGRLDAGITLANPSLQSPAWIQYAFAKPATMRALTMVGPLGGRFADGPVGRIEASDDGVRWNSIRTLTGAAHNPAPERTFAFAATTAKFFRVIFEKPEVSREPYPHPDGIHLSELSFVPGSRVDLFEDKAGFGVLPDADIPKTPPQDMEAVIAKGGVIDLTRHLRPDGSLDWVPPKGDWVILRMGYSPTGEINHPATPEATGPEADKLNAAHVQAHLDAYMAPVLKQLGPLSGSRGLRYIITDSWEAGVQNWTEAMPQEFAKRRGYDLMPWLPVLAGHIVGSAEQSDAFLWDFRRTLADLLAENHYGTITRFAKQHGLGYYGEAVGAAMPTIADGMLAKSYTDIPMGEFWAMPFGGKPAAYQGVRADEFPADIIETASTAHVYGKPLVAAESLTSSQPQWTATPWALKWVADKYMAMGVNRLVIHTSPHQPGNDHQPGLTLGPFGQAFTRNETWAGMAKPWIDYLSRSSFLLQQGKPVADILYFTGEGATSGVPYRDAKTPANPKGYGFDYANVDAMLRLASVEDKRIRFPSGASYRIFILPDGLQRMTLPLVQKLRTLVSEGAVIVGPKPIGSPSLASDDAAVRAVADQLWGATDGKILTRNDFGKGSVFWGYSPEAVLEELKLGRDFDFASDQIGMDLQFAHRKVDDGDIYFVTNQSAEKGPVTLRLRVTGKVPEIWHADTGTTEAVSYNIHDGATDVSLDLAPYEAAFVVLRTPATKGEHQVTPLVKKRLADISGGWALSFPAEHGGPASLNLERLSSWTESVDPSVRYYSGVGTYRKTITISSDWRKGGQRLQLDLGEVADLAEVRVNGRVAGIAWKPPYGVDISDFVRPGRNELEIEVANVWRNRLVGDQQPGAKPVAFTSQPAGGGFSALGGIIDKDTPLLPSGLLGPVLLYGVAR